MPSPVSLKKFEKSSRSSLRHCAAGARQVRNGSQMSSISTALGVAHAESLGSRVRLNQRPPAE